MDENAADTRLPWPARVQTEVLGTDLVLRSKARKRHPSVTWWWNQRTVGFVHGALCYLCDKQVATWARRWPIPQQAIEAVMAHRAEHLAEHAKSPE